MEVNSPKATIAYRGMRQPDTFYKKGDYVYVEDKRGYLYIATNDGYSQSSTKGKSSEFEPYWILFQINTDNRVQWTSIVLEEENLATTQRWQPNTEYEIGDIITPSSGPIVVSGSSTVYYGLIAKSIISYIDFPINNLELVQDNEVIWETKISLEKLLPVARLEEDIYVELCEVMDYLQMHNDIYFSEVINKFNDRNKLRYDTLQQIVGESGYTYITDVLDLTEEELRSIVSYLQMLHAFKGKKEGLEIVFELLNFEYNIVEWWETEEKGTPHTWNLFVEYSRHTDLDLFSRILKFSREYVYPILDKFEAAVEVNMAEMVAMQAGFIDKEYDFSNPQPRSIIATAGFVDKEFEGSVVGVAPVNTRTACVAGFADREFGITINVIPS